MSKILCLDPGTAHTGLAISEEGILATPLGTIFEKDPQKLIGQIIPYIAQHSPDTIVIGTPPHGQLVKFASDLKDNLEPFFSGDIVLFTEELSSKMARSIMKQSKKTLEKRKQQEHQTAAALILQEYLESM